MGNKLYVGNLPFNCESEELATLFGEEGAVESTKIIMDRDTGRSKGFAFVTMGTPEAAQACISRFNGYDHGGRQMKVSEAKPETPRDSRGGGGGGGFGRGGGGGGRGGWGR